MRHHGLPLVSRKDDGEAIEMKAVTTVLSIGLQDLLGNLGIREVLCPHGEPGHIVKRPGFRGGSNTGEWSHEEVLEVFA